MDITWLTDRIAVGGGIWTLDNMEKVVREEVTHIIDMQIEFDDTPLGEAVGVHVLWNPTDDDFDQSPGAVSAGSGFCADGARRAHGKAIHPLRSWSAPGADDGAGAVGVDGMDG